MTETPRTSDTFTAWVDALDALERDLDDALEAEPRAWTPPVGLSPLPPELTERAQRILLAQRALTARLDGERRAAGRHLAATRTVPSATKTGASVYLDVSG